MYARGMGDAKPVSFSFAKRSGASVYPLFQVGDTWTVSITGPPNSPIFVSGSHNNVLFATYQIGSTDASGTYSLDGTMDPSTVGNWFEQWWIGGTLSGGTLLQSAPLGTLNFNVVDAPAAPQTPKSTVDTTYANPAQVNQVLATSGLQIAGYDVPWWAVAGVGAGLLFMFTGGRR